MNKKTFSRLRFADFPPYKPSNQQAWFLPPETKPLKLDWNESPLPPSPKVFAALQEFLARPNALNWYPDADSRKLREAVAQHWHIQTDNVQTYCGSDSALQSAVRVFTQPGDAVLMVSPTYDNFRIYVIEADCRVILDGPDDLFTLTGDDLAQLIAKHNPRLVYIANPNNPTGWLVKPDEIERAAQQYPDTMLMLDEAYAEFSGVTSIRLAVSAPNIFVGRTFSKAYGLAGLRIGYVVATAGNIEQVNLIRNGKNVSMVGQVAALAALQDQEYLHAMLARLRRGQDVLTAGLTRLGLFYRATPANFVLIKFDNPAKIQAALAEQHIYVRPMSHLPKMTGFLRITLGNAEQMEEFLAAVEKLV